MQIGSNNDNDPSIYLVQNLTQTKDNMANE